MDKADPKSFAVCEYENDIDAHVGKDIRGNDWNIKDLEDGSQLWVTSKNGVIQNEWWLK